MFTRFDYLHILHRQDEIALLEDQLNELDNFENIDEELSTAHRARPYTHDAIKRDERRKQLLNDIKTKLDDYSDFLEEAESRLTVKPNPQEIEKVLSWFNKESYRSHFAPIRPNGLGVIVDGTNIDAFGDTGSGFNVVCDSYRKKRRWTMKKNPLLLTEGNGQKLFSPGSVKINVAMADKPDTSSVIEARVVVDFPFDLLLGQPFLKATRTLTEFSHRFKSCVFPRLWGSKSFFFTSGGSERFSAHLGEDVPFHGIPDTGSNCNVMDLTWAIKNGFEIHSKEEDRGHIRLSSGHYAPTIGKVHTVLTLPDGKQVPLTFEVLEHAANSVILRDEVVLGHKLYSAYPEAFSQIQEGGLVDELLHMDYLPWYVDVVRKAKCLFTDSSSQLQVAQGTNHLSEGEEMERRWEWDSQNGYGKNASAQEWMDEYNRRKSHEQAMYPNMPWVDKRLIWDMSTDLLGQTGDEPWTPVYSNDT